MKYVFAYTKLPAGDIVFAESIGLHIVDTILAPYKFGMQMHTAHIFPTISQSFDAII